MDHVIILLIALLVVASLVAIVARRLKLPYTVGLVATGVGLSMLGLGDGLQLSHDLIFLVILPPLLFEAALGIPWDPFRRDALPILVLATLGVALTAAIVGAGMVLLLGWPVRSAALFATLIAATDPVAVIAMFKDNRVGGRVRLLVESESLLNDGVAAALFGLVVNWVDGGSVSPIDAAARFLTISGGGVATGILCALGALAMAGRTADPLVETMLTAAAAYGSFLVAESWHVSGVLAAVSAGLAIGPVGRRVFPSAVSTQTGRRFQEGFWEFAAFIANSLIFLLIGLAVADIRFDGTAMTVVSVAALLTLLGRAVAVYGLCLPFAGGRWAVPAREQHVLWWGGLRGALALALALSLPPETPMRAEIVITTFGVVAVSVVVQGLTMPALLRMLGMLPS